MGRRTTRFVGERKGHLEVVGIIPQNKGGRHVQLELLCHACGNTATQSSVVFSKSKSCGCERHKAGEGKSLGPKTMPWQLESGEAARRLLVGRYKRSAKVKGLDFLLSDEDMTRLFKSSCSYCGRSETNTCKGLGKSSGDFAYVGLDRVDPFKGYTQDNVVPCCWMCNMMKNTLTQEAFLDHTTLIYKHVSNEQIT